MVSEQHPQRAEPAMPEMAGRPAVGTGDCLFCRRTDGGFTTVEHVLPESLGNTRLTLPKGVVCDRCNNGPLSELDQVLCEFFPIKFRRTMLGIESKAGRVPKTRFMTGELRNDGDDHLTITVDRENDTTTFREVARNGDEVELALSWRGGNKLTPRYAARLSSALLKGALECAWLDHGERMHEPDFDHIRDAVLGEPRDGFVSFVKEGNPNDNGLRLTYDLIDSGEAEGLWVVAQYYGISMATHSRLATPLGPLPDLVETLTFTAADLARRGT